MVAGYSGTPLERKLGVKPDHVVLLDDAPDTFDLDAPTTRRLPKRLDISLTFHTSAAKLEKRLPQLFERTEQAGMVWVCWPKKAVEGAHRPRRERRTRDRPGRRRTSTSRCARSTRPGQA